MHDKSYQLSVVSFFSNLGPYHLVFRHGKQENRYFVSVVSDNIISSAEN